MEGRPTGDPFLLGAGFGTRTSLCLVASAPCGAYFIAAAAVSRRRRSQGGVEIPTGGKPNRFPVRQARERRAKARVSRSGAMPEPTVIVRMKENGF